MTEQPANQWWILRYQPGKNWVHGAPAELQLTGHREFILNLHARGAIVAAGPIPETADAAVTVVRDLTKAQIDDAVSTDPAVIDGRLRVEVTSWTPLLVGD